uniref:NADH-ubiquinone oxidoreductase chain 4 n=1 Tax=Drilus flavescens TaxID=295522 RepID=E3VT94_9COLE|nr:NADH dehydrogenase subunit 4 [Drilus flavescens]
MMKFIFYSVFMILLSFLGSFWFIQMYYFILCFLFLSFFSFSYTQGCLNSVFSCDWVSSLMIILSSWICGLMILSSEGIYRHNYNFYTFNFTISLLFLSLLFTFSSSNLFIFYLFFEVSLVPTLFLILGWGYQPERIQAGFYMFFYTILASLPMMVSIFFVYNYFDSMSFYFMNFMIDSLFLYLCLVLVFLVKIPMFFVHLWLPKAHVEAPVSGSMILAGIMLKLGGYGFIRVMPLFISVGLKVNYYLVVISLFGGVATSLICLRQSDIKSLVAYSSVGHMGLVLTGLMTLSFWGLKGSVLMMVAHGLCSSGLFCLANLSYERLMSRSLFLTKGLINIMPGFSLWWFLLCSSNMAAPPSLNLVGEIILINSIVSWGLISIPLLMLISFFSAAYSLFLYSYSQHGKFSPGVYSFTLGSVREYMLLFLHWLPLNLLFLFVGGF